MRPLGKIVSFRSCVRCEAVCERETDEISVARVARRFTTPVGRVRRSRSLAAFWFKKCTTLARNLHFWLKTVKNVRASSVFIIRTVKNVRASRVFIFEIVVLLCFPDISVAKT